MTLRALLAGVRGAVRPGVLVTGGVAASAIAVVISSAVGGGPAPGCNLNATTATFAAQVTAATTGQSVCLATGDYGTFTGTNKVITIKAAAGATPAMSVDFTTGDSGFTLDGMTQMNGDIAGNANNITIKNSAFTGALVIRDLQNSNVLLDHNDHTRPAPISGDPALIHFAYCCPDSPSGVTVQNSLFHDTDADGIQAGAGVNIINNEFTRILENGPNHTDPIQLIYAIGSVVRGNWIHDTADGIVAYDGLASVLIEDNVVDPVGGRWGIELYSDAGSTVRHNTVVPRSGCVAQGCGLISVSHKAADDPTSGLSVYNNLTTGVIADSGDVPGLIRNDHNPTSTGALFVGGATPSSYMGYCLSPSSPTGVGAADNGINAGIHC